MPFRLKPRLYEPFNANTENFIFLIFFVKFYALCVSFLFIQRVLFYLWNIKFLHQESYVNVVQSFIYSLRFDLFLVSWVTIPLVVFLLLAYTVKVVRQLIQTSPSVENNSAIKISTAKQKKISIYLFQSASLISVLLFLFFSAINLVDIEFIHFSGRRMTSQSFFIFNEAVGKWGSYFLDYWILFITSGLLFALFIGIWSMMIRKLNQFFESKKNEINSQLNQIKKTDFLNHGLKIIILVSLTVISARGGLQSKPIGFVDAKVFNSPLLDLMMTNSGFSFIKSIDQKKAVKYSFFDSPHEELDKLNFEFVRDLNLKKVKLESEIGRKFSTQPNIVILVLESFSYEYMGLENNKSSYTPFLNSLAAKSYFFKNAMADGRRSIEGIAALLSGIPAWMEEPFISSEFSSNQFLGLGSFLKAYDYTTSFFHGGKNGTMYFDSFSRAAGFDNYFGLNEYPEKEKHFDGTWGIYDHLYFKDVIAKTNSLKKPFLNVIFTLSSHHPYKIPDEYQDKFLDQDLPILKSVMYADESLKEFFDEAKKQPWFENTIFILLADHTGKPNSEEFNHVIGSFRIPILLYSTKFNKDEIFESDKIIAQKDILNFIAEIVSIESRTNKVSFESATSDQIQKQFVFSKSIFDSSRRPHIVFDGFKYLVYDQFCLYEWSIEESQKYTLDSFFRKSLWTVEKNNRCSDEKFKSLEKYLKIHLQLFSEQLFDNRLYAPTR